MDMEPSNISHIEQGTMKNSLSTWTRIANLLGVTLDSVLCDRFDHAEDSYGKERSTLFSDCTASELRIITEGVKGLKQELHTQK